VNILVSFFVEFFIVAKLQLIWNKRKHKQMVEKIVNYEKEILEGKKNIKPIPLGYYHKIAENS